jgi:hypothetical protein
MSFNNYDSFQGQPSGEQPGAPGGNGAPPQEGGFGQPIDNGSGGLPGGNIGAPGGGQGQQGSEGKTTLW